MPSTRKDQIQALLKSLENGNTEAVAVVNEAKYIQHNPETHEGSEGLAALFKRISKTSPRVNIVRIFEDGDYVFGHTEYDFANSNIGFEVFRFEDGQAVEHWDNIQKRQGPNASGHSMVDGESELTDRHLTEINREMVKSFVENILIKRQLDKLDNYLSDGKLTQHSPYLTDGAESLSSALNFKSEQGYTLRYDRLHRILAEGNFVLTVSEGSREGNHSSFYDLYRVAEGCIAEHWDTVETVPPRSEWKNNNGKF
ncbi:nuclear transport factor 2 family protein [Amphritea japonica]|uniref:SnoaL-like domain-containing protein n=1 Tax=Amphritea japonica ATCC BAA-1530 TaxID=1278309 RepID=A0A7R6P3I9_9GAMM|nr:nuclear transport factor 2 family protein [Amphritea japonica]BBB26344.1 conserved hypothetical protein [Amphritea japonica ATCC BAA-1530]